MINNNLEGFENTWNMVLSGTRREPAVDELELLYFERIEKFNGISEDIAHYNRCDEGHPDRSYQFLRDAVARYLKRTRQKYVTEEIGKSLGMRCLECGLPMPVPLTTLKRR